MMEQESKNYVSASSTINFKLTPTELKEFKEDYAMVTELKSEESILLPCVIVHKETGLIFGTAINTTPIYLQKSMEEGHVEGLEFLLPDEKVAFLKDMFVVGVVNNILIEYHVKNPAQILKLFELIDNTHANAYIAMSSEIVKELIGDELDD